MSLFLHRAGILAGRTALSLIDSATSTGETITAPANIFPGDLLLLFDFSSNSTIGVPTDVTPSGFTQVLTFVQNSTFKGRCSVSKKIADGSEDGSTLTGLDGALAVNKVLLQFRGLSALSTATEQDTAGQMTSGDPSQQTCNASGGTPPLIVLGCYGGFSGISGETRTFSTTADDEINSSTSFYVKYKIYNSSPSDTNVDISGSTGGNALGSFYIELA